MFTQSIMSQVLDKPSIPVSEVSIEAVLLDADLFVKYRSPDKAFQLLRESLERSPRSIPLREKCARFPSRTEI